MALFVVFTARPADHDNGRDDERADALRYRHNASDIGSDCFDRILGGCLRCFEGWCPDPEYGQATVHIAVN